MKGSTPIRTRSFEFRDFELAATAMQIELVFKLGSFDETRFEKAENAYLSSFTLKKSKTLPGATAAAHGDPNDNNDYQKKSDENKLVETINVRFDENLEELILDKKLIVTLDIILNLPDYYDDEDDSDRAKDSLTSRLVSKTSTETPSTSEKPDVSSDNNSLIPCTEC
ncbi:hypothetical protein TNCV_4464491 [Trichonephila clavipes]|nr:hypothetical protein TNCV_4464491 [Trichonephila clavipes]